MSEKETGLVEYKRKQSGELLSMSGAALVMLTQDHQTMIERLQAELAALSLEKQMRQMAETRNVELLAYRTALALQVEQMREALDLAERELTHAAIHATAYELPRKLDICGALQVVRLALSTTTAEEILRQHDAKVIERCLAVIWYDMTPKQIAAAIRALIAAPKESNNV